MRNLLIAGSVSLLATAGCAPPRDASADLTQAHKLIRNKGSDTLVNVAQAWAEIYSKKSEGVAVAVSGGGSGTGFAALINGTVDIANASRPIEDEEAKLARERGNPPVELVVGFDALAVYVHKDNPLERISLAALADMYGEGGRTTHWTQLGIAVPGCRDQEIILVSRQNSSGTYAYFREAVLGPRRDYRLGTHDLHGSKDVVDLVQHTPCAIGYSGLAYDTADVKMLCIEANDGSCVRPSVATALDGTYRIARPLFMYTRGEPRGDIKTYLDWVLSAEGQCILAEKGYAPVRPVSCRHEIST